MAFTMFAKASSLLLLAATWAHAAPTTPLRARGGPNCSIVSTLQVKDIDVPTPVVGNVNVRFYDSAGVYVPENDGVSDFIGEYWPRDMRTDVALVGPFTYEGFDSKLWVKTLSVDPSTHNGGIMDIEFTYGSDAFQPTFSWLSCPIKTPLDAQGVEERQCWFPCAGYTG